MVRTRRSFDGGTSDYRYIYCVYAGLWMGALYRVLQKGKFG